MAAERLVIAGLKKSFGTNLVLRDLALALAPGEVHALIGGNGAGKSTLSKIIAGLESADAGTMVLDGDTFAPTGRRAAQRLGVVMVLQELTVLPTLTIAENLFLGELPTKGGAVIDRRRLRDLARSALSAVGLAALDPDEPAASLGVGHQQLVEIAAGVKHSCRLLILDEPTAALTAGEIETLFDLLRRLRAAGTTILYISHRLDEIGMLADRVSVLRDGQLVSTLPARSAPRATLIHLMAGATLSAGPAAPKPAHVGPPILRVSRLHAGKAVRNISLEARRGEILGLGGLVGAGRTELLRAIFGLDAVDSGGVEIGEPLRRFAPRNPADAVAAGVAFVPEDRKSHGIFGPLSLETNATIAQIPQRPRGWVNRRGEAVDAAMLLDRLQVKHAGPSQPIQELSGGNQQKIVIGRWLSRASLVWLLDEPTRGVDVRAREAIYQLLRERALAGCALIVASSDYEELAALCDRVIVLSQGAVAAEFDRATLSPAAFTQAAFSAFRSGDIN